MTNNICYSCNDEIENLSNASQIIGHDKPLLQCEDCMGGSNCFTCESCGDGLASQQVDYKPSNYREWWCISCTEDHYAVTFIVSNRWLFTEEEKLDGISFTSKRE